MDARNAQVFREELRSWVMHSTGCQFVRWAGEPEEMPGAAQIWIRRGAFTYSGGEVIRERLEDGRIRETQCTTGLLSLNLFAEVRDQLAGYTAFDLLSEVQGRLWLHESEQYFKRAGVGRCRVQGLTDTTSLGRIFDKRQLSSATLDLQFNVVFTATASALIDVFERIGIIVRVIAYDPTAAENPAVVAEVELEVP